MNVPSPRCHRPRPSTRRSSSSPSQDYVAERRLATAVFLSLKLAPAAVPRRRGGRRQDRDREGARRGAAAPLVRLQCYEGLDTASAVYEWNYPRQMIEIRLAEAGGHVVRDDARARHLHDALPAASRPILEALAPHDGIAPVLLIDELDRADEPFEAYLLEVLAEFQVTIPELGPIRAAHPPVGGHHVEPHARDPRRDQAPLPLPLGRLPRRAARARDPAPQVPARAGDARARDRRVHAARCARWTCSRRRASPRRSTGPRR